MNLPSIHREKSLLIQLCTSPDEQYVMRKLVSSKKCDEFGCNSLMYCLRYQRYEIFKYLLKEKSFDLNLLAKDQQGNTILHYAILYGGNDTQIVDQLIEIYKKFKFEIDQRNNLGFTPLLLAAFCGRYDLVLSFLTKTDASIFVRDDIQLKNLFDYLQINNRYKQLNSELKHLRREIYQTIPSRCYTYKNFFETIHLRNIQDQIGFLRSSLMELFSFKYQSSNLTHILFYLNRRYPNINISKQPKDIHIKIPFIFQRDNSKIHLHKILNQFDPNLRPTVIPPPSKIESSITKPHMTFKQLSRKLTTITIFSRPQGCKQQSIPIQTNIS